MVATHSTSVSTHSDNARRAATRRRVAIALTGVAAWSAFAIFGASATPSASAAAVRVHVTPVVSGFSKPVAIAARNGDAALYIAEQSTGLVRVVLGGSILATPALDLGGTVTPSGGEQGLLGIAFSLDGSKLYVDFTDLSGNSQVDEYTMTDSRTADPGSRRHLLSQTQPFSNHNGGDVVFGPDGMLYIAFGDGGGAGDTLGNAQNKATLLGKILRIDPTPNGANPYTIPAGNPFVGVPSARPEIWQYGVRNPWKFSFDRTTGEMWIGDVGQNLWEEIDYTPAGAGGQNFGWNLREGRYAYNKGKLPAGAVNPIFNYKHTQGRCSITGGYRYRGTAIPAIAGKYVYADFCAGKVMGFTPNATFTGGSQRSLLATVTYPTSFGEDNSGELYVLSTNVLYKLTN